MKKEVEKIAERYVKSDTRGRVGGWGSFGGCAGRGKGKDRQGARQSRAALAEAERRARREYESARQKAQKEAERTVLDAKGLAKSAAQSTEEFLKTKIAAAADEVLGGIRLKWQ